MNLGTVICRILVELIMNSSHVLHTSTSVAFAYSTLVGSLGIAFRALATTVEPYELPTLCDHKGVQPIAELTGQK